MEFDRVECFGKISVRIPRSWSEGDSEEADTHLFFEPEGHSGNLRVSLFTLKREAPLTIDTLRDEEFESREEEGVRFFEVGDDCFVAEWEKPAEKEEDTYMYWWTLTSIVGSSLIRKAIFSYAVSPDFRAEPGFAEHLEMVRECVFATHFIPAALN